MMHEPFPRRIWKPTVRRWWLGTAAAVIIAIMVPAPSGSGPDRTVERAFMSRAAARQQGSVTVRASVLSDDESQTYFGASLADHGIQAIWLNVDNASKSALRFLPI